MKITITSQIMLLLNIELSTGNGNTMCNVRCHLGNLEFRPLKRCTVENISMQGTELSFGSTPFCTLI